MIKSMTGFGATEMVVGAYHHRVEVRSVNSKFCDVKVKSPTDLNWLEIKVQQYIKQMISRGHVEVLLYRGASQKSEEGALEINWDLAEEYYKAYQSIRHKFGISHDVTLAMVTNAREVITLKQGDEDQDATWEKVKVALDEALKSVLAMRENEGKALAVDLAGRCNVINDSINAIAALAPTVVDSYRKRLLEKIESISDQELDQTRLAQEVCYFSDRCDITEELTRLKSHIQQFLHFLEESEPVGRKLDFLVQEMNRETNTIGSKSGSAEISQKVVDIKSEIEKLREQIQNVE